MIEKQFKVVKLSSFMNLCRCEIFYNCNLKNVIVFQDEF